MPLSPDEEQIAERLTALYRATEASLLEQIADAATSPRARSRLRALLAEVDTVFRRLIDGTRDWISRQLPAAYAKGATATAQALGRSFAWTQIHVDAVEALARSTWDDVAATLQQVAADTKRAVRSLLDDAVRRQILEGVPGRAAASELAAAIQAETGAATVRYANGARHSISDYADTVARTKTAETRNAGTFTQAREAGVEWVEVFDGPACGWSSHNDSRLANGLVVSLEEAEGQPLAHPRCARSYSPRPDIRSPEAAEEGRRYTLAEQEQMAAEERRRAATRNVDGRPRGTMAAPRTEGRQPRAARTPRTARA